MTWTQGRQTRNNQSPYRDAEAQRIPNQRPSETSTVNNPAASFTQEGLQAFASIFATTVEAAITKALSNVIEEVIDQKIQGFRSQLVHDVREMMRDAADSLLQQVANTTSSHTRPTSESRLKRNRPGVRQVSKRNDRTERQANREGELELVVSILREAGRPVRTHELRRLTNDSVVWGSNPSVKLSKFVHLSQGQILRIGKGVYCYSDTAISD